jgi:hypothetical protein
LKIINKRLSPDDREVGFIKGHLAGQPDPVSGLVVSRNLRKQTLFNGKSTFRQENIEWGGLAILLENCHDIVIDRFAISRRKPIYLHSLTREIGQKRMFFKGFLYSSDREKPADEDPIQSLAGKR